MRGIRSGRAGCLAAALALVPLLSACNIFEWTVDDRSFDALMADGHEALRDRDYALAEARFDAAVRLRPNHSEARYYFAKASVLNASIDVFGLVRTLTDDEGDGAVEIFDSEIGVANVLYRTNAVVLDALVPIREGEADEGSLAGADVNLDLGVAYTLRGILRLRDTNGDGVIDENDVSIEDFGLGTDDDGDYTLDGVGDVPPEDLNTMIDDLNELLGEGGDVLGDALGGSGIDIEDLNELIDSLGGSLSWFYVNTGVPGNPGEGDNDGDGVADEECLNDVDDDGDGIVDEDSRVIGCPAP